MIVSHFLFLEVIEGDFSTCPGVYRPELALFLNLSPGLTDILFTFELSLFTEPTCEFTKDPAFLLISTLGVLLSIVKRLKKNFRII